VDHSLTVAARAELSTTVRERVSVDPDDRELNCPSRDRQGAVSVDHSLTVAARAELSEPRPSGSG